MVVFTNSSRWNRSQYQGHEYHRVPYFRGASSCPRQGVLWFVMKVCGQSIDHSPPSARVENGYIPSSKGEMPEQPAKEFNPQIPFQDSLRRREFSFFFNFLSFYLFINCLFLFFKGREEQTGKYSRNFVVQRATLQGLGETPFSARSGHGISRS